MSTRFNLPQREADAEWLESGETLDGTPPTLRTCVTKLFSKTILSYNSSPDIGFDRSINPYRGCEHGCIYCYARPTHAYLDLSPGLDFETQLFVKTNASVLLRKELSKRHYIPKPIALGTNTDPYQPIERIYCVTRSILELCLECNHPLTITTKSDRILRDIDLLTELSKRNLVAIALSVTTLDPQVSSKLEPRCAAPAKRLAAIQQLSDHGIPVHCSVSPVIPSITDEYLEAILEAASNAGAKSASWIALRLPHEVAPLFRDWLAHHYPDRASKVMSIVQSMREGRDNDPNFHTRFHPKGVWADVFRARFKLACKRYSIGRYDTQLDTAKFKAPSTDGQLALF